MDGLERLLIERDCTRLSVDYGRLVDFGQAARVADLFTEDGLCELSAGRFEGSGRSAPSLRSGRRRPTWYPAT
jgi:SnoaL-like domain